MGALTDLRESLAEALDGALTIDGHALPVIDEIPETFTPPALLILPADDFINTAGLPHGAGAVSYELVAIYRSGTNPVVTAGLESLTEQLLDALHPLSWVLERVGKPVDLSTNTGTYPAVRCTVSRPSRIITD